MGDPQPAEHRPQAMDRRGFLFRAGGGLGGLALADLLRRDGLLAGTGRDAANPLAPRSPHHAPRAKNVIMIFCPGAYSQIDTFDYKPALKRYAGMSFTDYIRQKRGESKDLRFFASKPGKITPSYFRFRRFGQSGKWMSELFPNLGQCVDDMAFIHSLQSKSAVHGPAMFMMNTGFTMPGFPSMGAWVTYGLGSENDNLPAFAVLPHYKGVPAGGPLTWGAGFLPAVYQGTTLNTRKGEPPIRDLFPPDAARLDRSDARASRRFAQRLNSRFAARHEGQSELEARINTYELAARLQLSAPEATNLKGERPHTRRAYGLEDEREHVREFGRQCLLARRMVERGVRFVQVWCGADNTPPPRWNWDAHETVEKNHKRHGPALDIGAAALLKDLKRRGMLEETLVVCTTEFGRQPAAENGSGRDHNPDAATCWVAGGGFKGGVTYGATDELGYKAAENPVYSYSVHATLLHQLGLDHTRLTYYHNGLERRLTDVHGHVIRDLLA